MDARDEKQDQTDQYDLSLSGNGITIEKKIDQTTAFAILSVVMGAGTPIAPPTGAVHGASASSSGARTQVGGGPQSDRVALREYLGQNNAKNYIAKIVAIGAYLRDHEDTPEFTRDVVGARFKSAGEAPPGNLYRDFQTAVQNGWIAEDPKNKGSYFVTNTGNDVMAGGFEGRRSSTPGRKRGKQKKNATKDGKDKTSTSE